MTGTSRIYQKKRGTINEAGNHGSRRPDLCYLEHLVCGSDHLIETVDRIPCGLVFSRHTDDAVAAETY